METPETHTLTPDRTRLIVCGSVVAVALAMVLAGIATVGVRHWFEVLLVLAVSCFFHLIPIYVSFRRIELRSDGSLIIRDLFSTRTVTAAEVKEVRQEGGRMVLMFDSSSLQVSKEYWSRGAYNQLLDHVKQYCPSSIACSG